MFKFLAGMIAMAAVAAFFTKPSEQDAEAEMRNQLLNALANEQLEGKDGATKAALLGCRLSPDACYDLVRSGVETTYEDRYLYTKLSLEGFGQAAECYGVFTRFFCPGGLSKK